MDIDKVFRALADPTRRRLLDLLHGEGGQTLRARCAHMDMTRLAVTPHLQQLEQANLVAVVWQGREKLHYLNPVPLHEIQARWIKKFERSRLDALRDLKKKLEGDEDDKTELRVRDLHRDDGRESVAGVHQHSDQASAVDIVGKVVESHPPRRLVYTWARPKVLSNLRTLLETGRALPRPPLTA